MTFAALPVYTAGMHESGKNEFIAKKAYEISYALFRVSGKIADKTFAGILQGEGLALVQNAARGSYAEGIKAIHVIKYFVKLGIDFDYMGLGNGDILLHELNGLESAILEQMHPANVEQEVDIAEIFSKKEEEAVMVKGQIFESEIVNAPGVSNVIKSGMRQSAILDRIRQSGNCRIRDLQEILPDSSERTIRYDLQSLIEQGLIERVGTGGPAVFYRIRQNTATIER